MLPKFFYLCAFMNQGAVQVNKHTKRNDPVIMTEKSRQTMNYSVVQRTPFSCGTQQLTLPRSGRGAGLGSSCLVTLHLPVVKVNHR